MMDAVDHFELAHGVYPIAFDRRWHCGAHLAPDTYGPVYAIADGEVVAYRVCQHAMDSGNGNAGFVLLKHTTETGDGRTITFYSLYMHLLPLAEYHEFGFDGKGLPEFLHLPTGRVPKGAVEPAAVGGGRKVRRKDILGYIGRYERVWYMHFEIFMLPGDFDAYFGHTQLGVASPATASTQDCWGQTYYMIPAGQQFFALPPGTGADNRLYGIKFEPGHTDTNTLPLVVEAYFSKGAKYTSVWSVAADGSRTLLTPNPVEEKDYEYDLYRRATALYGACPSDGYEMLRFGRILSTPATLAENARATWVRVTYAAGKHGYIDISKAAIRKLSDADFPSFMGWQKLSDGNTPFGSDGMCDIEVLKKLVKDAADNEPPTVAAETTEVQKAGALSRYVRGHDGVRQALRGFICNAPSEWDSTHNETRYAKLLDEGGFYHGNEQGYNKFLTYLKEIQFWDATGLPAGQNLWFFHPLAFIRHFRKCGWLSAQEYMRMFPPTALRSVGHGQWVSERVSPSREAIAGYGAELNKAMCKFGITTPLRQAAFLGNAMQETQWFSSLSEGASTPPPRYAPWIGRGFLQLTWPDNYVKYWRFCGRQVDLSLADRLHEAAHTANTTRNNHALIAVESVVPVRMQEWRRLMGIDKLDATNSATAYWAWSGAAKYADMHPVLRRETKTVGMTPMPYYSCESFGQVAATVNVGHPSNSFSGIYGLQARFQGYTSALMALTDWTEVRTGNGSQLS
ncbi:peptidase M23 [Paraburkholderia sacchari]|uniref:peptidase M23 n=1 Tax=Paraburkholderia sacchari TaxID=159450 RepID=UPI0039A6BBF7